MKSMNRKLPLDFYVDPGHKYGSHKLNILKECLVEWMKPENSKFYPKWDEFRYHEEDSRNGGKVLHCYVSYAWVSEHKLLDIIEFLA